MDLQVGKMDVTVLTGRLALSATSLTEMSSMGLFMKMPQNACSMALTVLSLFDVSIFPSPPSINDYPSHPGVFNGAG
jgi:hypothetical protein